MFITQITNLSFDFYNNLGKSGKPKTNDEWTILAAIIINYENDKNQLIALSTGTKCFASGNCENQDKIIQDCHAESLLKRAFKRYLISRIKYKQQLNDFKVTLFISQLPCGVVQRWKGAQQPNMNPNDLNLTHENVVFSKKPGRGELCLKPTCMNKFIKWNLLGLQGRRLMEFTKKPIRINNIIIGNCGQIGEFDEQFLARLFKTANLIENDLFKSDDYEIPNFMFNQEFRKTPFIKTDSNSPSPSSIVAWKEGDGNFIKEIVTGGRQHGVTKKNSNIERLLISDLFINQEIDYLLDKSECEFSDKYTRFWNAIKVHSIFKAWSSSST